MTNWILFAPEFTTLLTTVLFLGLSFGKTPAPGRDFRVALGLAALTWSGFVPNHLDIAPHWALFPGAAIFLAVLTINFIGDGLRDALDPRRVL